MAASFHICSMTRRCPLRAVSAEKSIVTKLASPRAVGTARGLQITLSPLQMYKHDCQEFYGQDTIAGRTNPDTPLLATATAIPGLVVECSRAASHLSRLCFMQRGASFDYFSFGLFGLLRIQVALRPLHLWSKGMESANREWRRQTAGGRCGR